VPARHRGATVLCYRRNWWLPTVSTQRHKGPPRGLPCSALASFTVSPGHPVEHGDLGLERDGLAVAIGPRLASRFRRLRARRFADPAVARNNPHSVRSRFAYKLLHRRDGPIHRRASRVDHNGDGPKQRTGGGNQAFSAVLGQNPVAWLRPGYISGTLKRTEVRAWRWGWPRPSPAAAPGSGVGTRNCPLRAGRPGTRRGR
jgi:hypothetical protein